MKKLTGLLLPILALTILATGFLLPDIVSAYQHSILQSETERYDTNIVHLETAAPNRLSEVLRLAARGYKKIQTDFGKSLTADDAYLCAQNLLDSLSDSGLIALGWNLSTAEGTGPVVVYKLTPVIAVDESGKDAAVLWECEFSDSSNSQLLSLVLDDESGKMVSLLYREGGNLTTATVGEDSSSATKRWANFCQQYYGFQLTEIFVDTREGSLLDEDRVLYDFTLSLQDENGQTLELLCTASEQQDYIYINRPVSSSGD